MKTRIELETDINNLGTIAEDLRMIGDTILDGPTIITEDTFASLMYGLADLHDLRVTHALDTFAQVFELNQYAPSEFKERWKEFFDTDELN